MGKRKPRGGYRAGAECLVRFADWKTSPYNRDFRSVIIRSLPNGKFEVMTLYNESLYDGRLFQVLRKQIRLTGVNYEL